MKESRMERHSSYYSLEWRLKALEVKKRDGCRCQVCNNRYNLEVHHKYYIKGRALWDYPSELLITLCRRCHQSEHAYLDLFKIKNIKISYYLLAGFTAYDLYAKMKAGEWFMPKK